MSQQRKIPVDEMVRIVELYLSKKIGYKSAYQEAGVSEETFRKWLFRYKTDGPTGFLPKEHNKRYINETKLKRERYYGYKFTSRENLVQAISDYIFYV
ncbi:IS3 family transposase [Desulfosporosinus sp. Sb-LF]|uniref:helix-turn-helix domain-containing protein n=1 Tax=Desulfosporosinus sp. Sb-LF TaxID=2560027 RepID=UPI001305299C|nr:IS3 family transposase [Desulfosporosinus sp. Sb-LF]